MNCVADDNIRFEYIIKRRFEYIIKDIVNQSDFIVIFYYVSQNLNLVYKYITFLFSIRTPSDSTFDCIWLDWATVLHIINQGKGVKSQELSFHLGNEERQRDRLK